MIPTDRPIIDHERVAPGARLASLASNLGYESLDFANALSLTLEELAKVYNGVLRITLAFAYLIEEKFRIPACIWKRLEDNFRTLKAWGLVRAKRATAIVNGEEILWELNRLDHAYPPGDYLVDVLKDRGFDKADCARLLGLSMADFDRLRIGELPFTLDFAEAIEKRFGISASLWMSLEEDWRAFNREKAEERQFKLDRPKCLEPRDCVVPTYELLQEVLCERKLSPDDLARRSGLPIETVNKILAGEERLFDEPVLSGIAEALDIPASFLHDLETQFYADEEDEFG